MFCSGGVWASEKEDFSLELFYKGFERTHCVSPISHLHVCLLLNPLLLPEGMQEEDKPAAENEEEEGGDEGEEEEEDAQQGETLFFFALLDFFFFEAGFCFWFSFSHHLPSYIFCRQIK